MGSLWHLITVLCKQGCFVGLITMGPLPTCDLHKIATQCHLSLIKRTDEKLATGGKGLSRVHGWGVHFLSDFVAATVGNGILFLPGIKSCKVDSMRVKCRRAMGHPIRYYLAYPRAILHPDSLCKP